MDNQESNFVRGSEWRQWDLHFHTPSSYDYADNSVTNQQMVDVLLSEGIRVVAVTDHHNIDVQRIRELQSLGGDKLTVLPGIEFRSDQGGEPIHYISIFPEDCDLEHVWTTLQGYLGLTGAAIQEKGGKDNVYVPIEKGADETRELGGLVSIHAGSKSNSIESISNKDQFQQRIKYDITKEWRPSIIGSEFNLTMGQSPSEKTYNKTGDGLPFFQERRDFGFRFPTNRVYYTAPKRLANHGDTLVSVHAPVMDINRAMEQCCVGRGIAGIRYKSGSRSYTFYAMHTLSDRFARFEAEGTVFGAINKKQFECLLWLSPPGDLVNEFEKITFTLDEQIEKNTNKTVTLASLHDTILPKLISGKRRGEMRKN